MLRTVIVLEFINNLLRSGTLNNNGQTIEIREQR